MKINDRANVNRRKRQRYSSREEEKKNEKFMQFHLVFMMCFFLFTIVNTLNIEYFYCVNARCIYLCVTSELSKQKEERKNNKSTLTKKQLKNTFCFWLYSSTMLFLSSFYCVFVLHFKVYYIFEGFFSLYLSFSFIISFLLPHHLHHT